MKSLSRETMISFRQSLPILMGLGVAFFLAGCGSGNSSGAAKTPEAAKAALQQAFAKAPAEVKAIASEVEAAMQNQEDGKAFLQLSALSARQDLNQEQRGAAAISMLAVGQKLNAAAAAGDRDAAALMESYRANK